MTTEKESLEQRIAELSAVYGDGKDVVNDSSKDGLIARLEAEHQNFQGVFNVEKGIFFDLDIVFYTLICFDFNLLKKLDVEIVQSFKKVSRFKPLYNYFLIHKNKITFVVFLEKVKQLEDKNFLLETQKEEMETELEEMSQANIKLQDEIREAKDMLSTIDLNLPPMEKDSGTYIWTFHFHFILRNF